MYKRQYERYGFNATYEFLGKLSDSGGTLRLVDERLNDIIVVSFGDGWADNRADGLGFSLNFDPSYCDATDKDSFVRSMDVHGTPGALNNLGLPVGPGPIILNEFNAVKATDLIQRGDARLGLVLGNGQDWFELVVVDDHLDLRNFELEITCLLYTSPSPRD